ncbi:MAG: phosphoribosylformylglycinamidine synthase subunit PurL [Bacteriovoracaceae bacterium]
MNPENNHSYTRIEVYNKFPSKRATQLLERLNLDLRETAVVEDLEIHQFYLLKHDYDQKAYRENQKSIITTFSDPAISTYSDNQEQAFLFHDKNFRFAFEIGFKPGVTDNPAHSAIEALEYQGVKATVASGTLYFFKTEADAIKLKDSVKKYVVNELIESLVVYDFDNDQDLQSWNLRFHNIKFPTVILEAGADYEEVHMPEKEEELLKLSDERLLALNLEEMQVVRNFFLDDAQTEFRKEKGLPQAPTDVELEVIAQTWSEHCKHKIFSAKIDYSESGRYPEDSTQSPQKLGALSIDSLYRSYIKKTTSVVAETHNRDWLVSVFSDNAGLVDFDPEYYLCAKVETHNSPSALDPYGGALTGILGVNRDILGCGMGAEPIANMDVFCFAELDHDKKHPEFTPSKLLPPSQILAGVHKGVEDGGNKSGIPTVNGAIHFHPSYAGKPLVFVGTIGMIPKKVLCRDEQVPSEKKEVKPGDLVYMVGGDVGADGIHGATFSSLQLDENSPSTAVQIGDPLTQKKVWDFMVVARDKGLYSCVTDNGAGGLSSSVGEMATLTNGAQIDLALCPLKYPGLRPFEIMISESQERLTVAVDSRYQAQFESLAKKMSVSATNIGKFTDGGHLDVRFENRPVALIDLDFLHEKNPQLNLKAEFNPQNDWMVYPENEKKSRHNVQLSEMIKDVLSHPNIASKENLVRQYDHEVQASTVIKPFAGKTQIGPNDCGGIWMKPKGGGEDNVILTGVGLCPQYSKFDTYHMAQMAVDEALRNVVSSGGNPKRTAILDNFCWPDPVESSKNPDGKMKLAQLVRCCHGLSDISETYGLPLISGKDSMKNDFYGKSLTGDDVKISILPTLLVTAMSQTKIEHTIDTAFKSEGDDIFLVGQIWGGLTLSVFEEKFDILNPKYLKINKVRCSENLKTYEGLHGAISQNLLQSCHDISDGGLMTSVLESSFGGGLGVDLEFGNIPGLNSYDDLLAFLFHEASGRFVVSVSPNKLRLFEVAMKGIPKVRIGQVKDDGLVSIQRKTKNELKANLNEFENAWKSLK